METPAIDHFFDVIQEWLGSDNPTGVEWDEDDLRRAVQELELIKNNDGHT